MRAAEIVLPVYSGGGGDGSPSNSSAPVVSGSTVEGDTLSCTEGLWTNAPFSYTYQWVYAGIGNISGAILSTYTLGSGDVGYDIYCAVTATNLAGSATADSNTVGPVTSSGEDLLPYPSALNALPYTWELLGHDEFEGTVGQKASEFLSLAMSGTQLGWSVGDLNNGAVMSGGPGNTDSSVQQGGGQFCGNASVISLGTDNGILLRQQPAGGGTWQPTGGPGSSVSSVSDEYESYGTETGGITSANIWTLNPRALSATYGTSLQPGSDAIEIDSVNYQYEMVLEVQWAASPRQNGSSVYPFIGSYNEGNFGPDFPEDYATEVDWSEANGALPQNKLNIHVVSPDINVNGSANIASDPTDLHRITYHIRTNSSSDSSMMVYNEGTVVSDANEASASDWWNLFSSPAFLLLVNGGGPITAATDADVNDCQVGYVRVWRSVAS